MKLSLKSRILVKLNIAQLIIAGSVCVAQWIEPPARFSPLYYHTRVCYQVAAERAYPPAIVASGDRLERNLAVDACSQGL